MSKVYLKIICQLLTDKTGIDASQILDMPEQNMTKQSRIELAVKDFLDCTMLSIKEKNAFKKTLTKSYFNHINKVEIPEGYVSLSDYVSIKQLEGSNIRESEIKKLLIMQSYMVKNYVTDKSYRLNAVHTIFITYQLLGRQKSKQILKLWKVKFLDRLLKQNSETFEKCRTSFSFTRPRSNSESWGAINRALKILTDENPSLPRRIPDGETELLDYIKLIKEESDRTKSLINYLSRHLKYRMRYELN